MWYRDEKVIVVHGDFVDPTIYHDPSFKLGSWTNYVKRTLNIVRLDSEIISGITELYYLRVYTIL